MFDQCYIIRGTYWYVTTAIMDSANVNKKVTSAALLPVVLFAFF